MSLAKVYFTQYDKLADAVVQETLQRSSGAIKKEIAALKLMRTIPNIRFEYDKLEDNARSLEDIFAQIRNESPKVVDEPTSEEEDDLDEEEDDSIDVVTDSETKED